MSRTLTVDINVIDPRPGDTFGYDVTTNGVPFVFTQVGQLDSIGWNKTYITSTTNTINMGRILKVGTGLTQSPTLIGSVNNGSVVDLFRHPTTNYLTFVGSFTQYQNKLGVSSLPNRMILLDETNNTPISLYNSGFSTGPNNNVNCTTQANASTFLVGGNFTTYDGFATNRLALVSNVFNSGSTVFRDNIMSAATNKGFNGSVNCIIVQPDGRIVVGGDFTNFNNNSRNGIVRINANGTLDNTFHDGFTGYNVGTGFNGSVKCMLLDLSFVIPGSGNEQGRLYVGGDFTTYRGLTCSKLVRIYQTSGNLDPNFNVGTGFNDTVRSLTFDPSGNIIVGGDFTTYNGNTRNKIVKLSKVGVDANAFGTGFATGDSVKTIEVNGTDFYVGGSLTSYRGNSITNFVKIDSSGNYVDKILLNAPVNKIRSYGSELYLMGDFTSYNVTSGGVDNLYNIALPTGVSYSFGSGFAPSYNTNITQALEDTNGDLLIVRGFNTYKGISCPGAVRMTKSGNFISGAEGAGFLVAMLPNLGCIKSDGSMVFITANYNGVPYDPGYIVGLNSDFTIDYNFIPNFGFDDVVDDSYKQIIDVLSDDSIIINAVGPTEYDLNFLSNGPLLKISATGSFDTDFYSNLPSSFTFAPPNCIDIKRTGDVLNDKILVGGGIADYTFILNYDGTQDTSFSITGLFDGEIRFCKFCPDGKIILAGKLNSTLNYPNMVRLNADGSLDTTFNTGTGFIQSGTIANTTIRDIKFIDDKIYISGRFNNYNGATVSNIVRLNNNGTLDTTFVTGTGFNSTAINALAVDGNNIMVFSNFTTYKGLTLSSPRVAVLDSVGNLATISNATREQEVYVTYDNLVEFNSATGITYSIIGDTVSVSKTINFTNTTPLSDVSGVYVIQPDDKAIIFNTYVFSGTSSSIIRINPDGTLDNSFNTGVFTDVRQIVIQPDNKILIGSFDSTGNGIVRLNIDGTLDTTFSFSGLIVGNGDNGNNFIGLLSDNSIYTYSPIDGGVIYRVSATGSTMTSFGVDSSNPYVVIDDTSKLVDIKKQSDDKLLLSLSATSSFVAKGGTFSKGPGIHRLNTDGSFDNTYSYNAPGLTLFSQPMGIDSSDRIYQPLFATSSTLLKRFNTDGSLDTSFNLEQSSLDIYGYVFQNDGKIIVTGFDLYDGTNYQKLLRLNTNGSLDTSFNSNADNNVGSYMFGKKYNSNEDMLMIPTIEGSWPTFVGTGTTNITRIDKDGNEVLETDNYRFNPTGVRMTYQFDDENIVINDIFDTPDHVEIGYTNTSITINELIQEVVVRSPYLVISNEPVFDTTNYKIKIYEGPLFSFGSQSVDYNITKQKLFTGQDNIFVNVNNLVREDLEANVADFLNVNYTVATDLPENMSKWVYIEETNYNAGVTAGVHIRYLIATDGFLNDNELQQLPNVLLTGDKRYMHRNQPQRVYFQTNFLTGIQVTTVVDSYPATFDVNVDLLNTRYIQSLSIDTSYFEFIGADYVDYTFTYSNSSTIVKRFYMYNDCKYDLYTLVYKNKYGVLESMAFSKKSSKRIETTGVAYQRSILDYNGDYDIRRHTNKEINVNGYETITLNTDWIPEYMNAPIREIMLSEEVWLLNENNTLVPVVKVDNSIDYKTHINDKLIQYTIKVKLSHSTIKNIL